jgi:UDP-glucuronate 4-epimerase
MRRDFTFIDDIVAGVIGCLDRPEGAGRVYNIGGGRPERVADLVALLESALGRPAMVRSTPAPATEVGATCADTTALEALTGAAPQVTLADGVARWAEWYRTTGDRFS